MNCHDYLYGASEPGVNSRRWFLKECGLGLGRSRDNQHTAPLEVAVDKYEKGQFTPTQTQIEERVMMDALITAMNSELTDDQRHVIILRFLEDFSLKETADIIGKEVNNIKVIQNRGIAKLRKSLGLQLEESW